MPSNHLILCRPLILLPSTFPSIRVFSKELALHIRWPKYWSFSFNISPSNEHLGLISFRMNWLDPLAVQGILKSLLQHHSSKAFRYDLNQIPYNYTVEVRNRFKGLDLTDRVPDELWTEVCDIVQDTGIKIILRKRNAKKQNGCLGRPYK